MLLLAVALIALTAPRSTAQEPPPLVVATPYDHYVTNNTTLNVTGTTIPGANVTVTVECREDKSAYTTVALADGRFCVTVELIPFIQLVNVTASDANGTSSRVSLTVFCDNDPPRFIITDPISSPFWTNRPTYMVKVLNTGDNEVDIHINGRSIAGSRGMEINLTEGANTVTVRAVDGAGNTAVKSVVLILDTRPPDLLTVMDTELEAHTVDLQYPLWGSVRNASKVVVRFRGMYNDAGIEPGVGGAPDIWRYTLLMGTEDGRFCVTVKAYDAVGNHVTDSLWMVLDRVPPVFGSMVIVGDARDALVHLNGSVDEDVLEVSAGGQAYEVVDGHFSIPWSQFHGWNTIEVQSADRAGNRATKSVESFCSLRDPALELQGPLLPEDGRLRVRGWTDGYIDRIMVGTTPIPVTDGRFDAVVNLTGGQEEVTFRVEDPGGAVTERTVRLEVPTEGGLWTSAMLGVAAVVLAATAVLVVHDVLRRRSRT